MNMKYLPRLIGSRRWRAIEHFKKHPHEVQAQTLASLLHKASKTEFGKKYNFKNIKSWSDFQSQVPISNYDDLKPYIEKILNGDDNVLWPGKILWFAKSSGTTSDKSKFLPISRDALQKCHYRAGKDVLWLYYLNYPDTRIYRGQNLIIGGSHQINTLNKKSRLGDLSAVLIQNLPALVHLVRTPRLQIALMSEWEEKIRLMAEETIRENVTNISGVPSWTLVLIKKIFEITGQNDLRAIWPNLEVFIHGGVSFAPYRAEFAKLIPHDDMRYMEVYNASEGFFAIQDKKDRDDMLLMLDYGIFYEFIDMDNWRAGNMKALDLSQVELGKDYAMLISTNTGLWRYVIGDVVKFTDLKPYRLKISGRTAHFINVFGEELMIANVEKALSLTATEIKFSIKDYTVAPVFMSENNKGRHEWLIEFYEAPNDLNKFMEILDAKLKSINSDYEGKRQNNMALDFPLLNVARENLFTDWLRSKGKLGGQHKVPRLSNDRMIIEELLMMK